MPPLRNHTAKRSREPIGIVNQDNITDRQREIMTSLIRHMHGFVKDVKLQHSEFTEACQYLVRAGKLSNDNRQEFILLADILGIEVLVPDIANCPDNPAQSPCPARWHHGA